MANLLQNHLRLAACTVASLKQGVLPLRRPSWNDHDFWAKSITQTRMDTVAGNMVEFQDFLTFKPSTKFAAIFDSYVMDTYDAISGTNIQFRIRRNEEILVKHLDQVEWHKEAQGVWPLVPAKTFITAGYNDLVNLQVFNPDPNPQLIFASLIGWQYVNFSSARGDFKEGIYDVRTVR